MKGITATITTPRGENIGTNILNTLRKTYGNRNFNFSRIETTRQPEMKSNTTIVTFH